MNVHLLNASRIFCWGFAKDDQKIRRVLTKQSIHLIAALLLSPDHIESEPATCDAKRYS